VRIGSLITRWGTSFNDAVLLVACNRRRRRCELLSAAFPGAHDHFGRQSGFLLGSLGQAFLLRQFLALLSMNVVRLKVEIVKVVIFIKFFFRVEAAIFVIYKLVEREALTATRNIVDGQL